VLAVSLSYGAIYFSQSVGFVSATARPRMVGLSAVLEFTRDSNHPTFLWESVPILGIEYIWLYLDTRAVRDSSTA